MGEVVNHFRHGWASSFASVVFPPFTGAKQSKAEQSRAKQSKAEQSRAKQSKAEQSRAKQSKATRNKVHSKNQEGYCRNSHLLGWLDSSQAPESPLHLFHEALDPSRALHFDLVTLACRRRHHRCWATLLASSTSSVKSRCKILSTKEKEIVIIDDDFRCLSISAVMVSMIVRGEIWSLRVHLFRQDLRVEGSDGGTMILILI
ncbi:predicted protein [Histoplasma capsulatum var. duboisii H88]|uniref:Predicted protein n=1 Tax=Ajellomyces capsulatus (strain H88) TaxID=544711 RepID=F0UUL8_AJEC8|nr:predicted protein [Histoplasma capsulatum var. duboisii H88]